YCPLLARPAPATCPPGARADRARQFWILDLRFWIATVGRGTLVAPSPAAALIQNRQSKIADLLGGFQREAAAEDGEAREEGALRFVQLVVAPIDRRAQRLVPRMAGARAGGQQPKAIRQPLRELIEA